jgi:hypothetical protein
MSNQTPPAAQRWALAATAILTNMTRRAPRHDCLGGAPQGPDSQSTAKTILLNSWGIDSRQKLESTLEWLSTGGHSTDYQNAAAAFGPALPQQRLGDPKLAFVGQYGAQLANRGLLAWDLGRLLAVAGWGYLAGFCSDVEAWGIMLPAAERLRNTYASWEEYGHHYRLGCLFWSADAVGTIDAILVQLGSAPDSPWKTVPWRLDANANVGAAPYGTPGVGAYGGAPPVAPPPASPLAAGAYGAPPGASPYGGVPAVGAYGGVPVVAPPVGGASPYGGAPGIGAYGGVPVISPSPGGAALAPAPYGGAPIIYPSPGGGGMPRGPGAKRTMLFVALGLGGIVFFVLVGGLAWHFTHEPHESHEHEHHHH